MKYKVKILKQPKYQDGGKTLGDFSNLTEDQLENGLVYGYGEEPEEIVVANSSNDRPTLEALVPAQYKMKPVEKEPLVGVPISVLQTLQKPKYNGQSIVNFLNKINAPSSYNYRKKLAAENNIKNYTGTASQNLKLLSILSDKENYVYDKETVNNLTTAATTTKKSGKSYNKKDNKTKTTSNTNVKSIEPIVYSLPQVSPFPQARPSLVNPVTGKLLSNNQMAMLMNAAAQQKQAVMSAAPERVVFNNNKNSNFNDSYYLNMIEQDPKSEANIGKRMRKELVTKKLPAALTAAAGIMGLSNLIPTVEYFKIPKGLPKGPQGKIPGPRNIPTAPPKGWTSPSGMASPGYPFYQYGGNMEQEDGGQQQVLQIIQAYAEASGVDPKELMTKLQSMDAEEQQQIIAQMYQALQGGGAEQQQQQGYAQQEMQPSMQEEESDDESYNEEDDMPEAAYGGQMGYGLDLGSRRLWMNQDDDEQSLVNRSIKEVPREEANIEAEGGETALIPNKDDNNYSHFNIQGKKHTNGGVPLNVPEGTFIYSDTKKMKLGGSVLKVFGKSDKTSKKYTPAALAKQYDLNKYTAILESPKSSQIERRTAELMIQNYNKKLAQLALVQEEKKGYPQGIPAVAKEYYAKTKAYVEEQQARGKKQQGGEQEASENVDQDMEQGKQMEAMYGMGFRYGGGLQRFAYGNEFKGVPYSYTKPQVTRNDLLGIQPVFTPNEDNDNFPTAPSNLTYKNEYDNSNVVENNNPQFEGWGDSEAGKKYGAIAANYANNLNNNNNAAAQSAAKGLVKGAVTSKNEDEDEFKINKSNIEYGWSNPDKLNLLNSFINLAGVRKATPFEPTVKLARSLTRYIDPARALAANTEQYNAARQAAAMFAGPQSRYSFNAGQFGKNAADIISQYGNQNVQLGNVAAAQDADITNKQIMYDAQRAKRLYDAGVIGEQQYQNAMKQARAGVLQAYGQGMKNAADIYNMSMSQSPYYGIDRKRGTIYFHSPKAMGNFYSQQNQSPNDSYASAWKRAQEEADQMDFKSNEEKKSYVDKAADYYSKQSTPSRRRTT